MSCYKHFKQYPPRSQVALKSGAKGTVAFAPADSPKQKPGCILININEQVWVHPDDLEITKKAPPPRFKLEPGAIVLNSCYGFGVILRRLDDMGYFYKVAFYSDRALGTRYINCTDHGFSDYEESISDEELEQEIKDYLTYREAKRKQRTAAQKEKEAEEKEAEEKQEQEQGVLIE